MSNPPTIPEILALLRQAIERDFPGFHAKSVVIRGADRQDKIRLPIPIHVPSQVQAGHSQEEPEEWQPFIPTPFQKGILKALSGKALRVDALGAAVGDKSRLYKPHGLQELRDRGLVMHMEAIGFYRPDAPPPELQEGESTDE